MRRERPHFPREPPTLCFVTFGIAGRSLRISECSGPDLKRGQAYLQNTSQPWLQEHVTPLNAMPGTLPVPRKEYHCHHTLATQRWFGASSIHSTWGLLINAEPWPRSSLRPRNLHLAQSIDNPMHIKI